MLQIVTLTWLLLVTGYIVYDIFTTIGNRGGRRRGESSAVDDLYKQVQQLSHSQKESFTKIGIVRFNPFERVGGEQSYSIALLNDKGSGFVQTYLYSREGVRTYCKEVTEGKGKEELSQEEKKAIVKAGVL